jgi:hypothetical protein
VEVESHCPLGPRGVAGQDGIDHVLVLLQRYAGALRSGQFVEDQPVERKGEPQRRLLEHRVACELVEQIVKSLAGFGESLAAAVGGFPQVLAALSQALGVVCPMNILRSQPGRESLDRLADLKSLAHIALGVGAYGGSPVRGEVEQPLAGEPAYGFAHGPDADAKHFRHLGDDQPLALCQFSVAYGLANRPDHMLDDRFGRHILQAGRGPGHGAEPPLVINGTAPVASATTTSSR